MHGSAMCVVHWWEGRNLLGPRLHASSICRLCPCILSLGRNTLRPFRVRTPRAEGGAGTSRAELPPAVRFVQNY